MRKGIALLVVVGVAGAGSAAAGTAPAIPPPALVPNAIAFTDRLHGVLVTGWESCVDHAWHCVPRGTISITGDGGRTWTVVRHTGRPVVSVVRGGGTYLAQLDDGEYLRSTGGRHWTTALVPPTMLSPCTAGMHAYVAGTWALCMGQGAAGTEAKAVYRFTRTGPHRVAYTPMTGGPGYGGLSALGYPLGISGNEQGFAIIWESRGTLFVTRDGGHHWIGLPKLAPPDLVFGDGAYALPGGVGFALLSLGGSEKRRLIETTDAGHTWHVVRLWACTAKRERCGDARTSSP